MSQITSDILQKLAPGTPKNKRDRFLPYFNDVLPRYEITTELRVAAFLATVCFESDFFKATEEYASGIAYDITRNREKAIALGNTEKGDGVRYKGRTGIQTTGKKNYARLTKKIGVRDGVDFVKNPAKLSENKYFVEGACVYWDDNKLNAYADKGKFFAIQGLVNRGTASKQAKDYPKRLAIYDAALRSLPDNFNLSSTDKSESRDSKMAASFPAKNSVEEKDADGLGLDSPRSLSNLGGAPSVTNPEQAGTEGSPNTPPNQTAENITNVNQGNSLPENFQPKDLAVTAPPPSGIMSKARLWVASIGLGVPSLAGLIDYLKNLFSDGVFSLKDAFATAAAVAKFVFPYAVYLAIAFIVFWGIKELLKQASLMLKIYTHARGDMNNVEVLPTTAPTVPTSYQWMTAKLPFRKAPPSVTEKNQ